MNMMKNDTECKKGWDNERFKLKKIESSFVKNKNHVVDVLRVFCWMFLWVNPLQLIFFLVLYCYTTGTGQRWSRLLANIFEFTTFYSTCQEHVVHCCFVFIVAVYCVCFSFLVCTYTSIKQPVYSIDFFFIFFMSGLSQLATLYHHLITNNVSIDRMRAHEK